MFPLEIFPPGGLTSSVITTVWVGIIVISFFNLRYGWVFSGLVIPGYLVPLMMSKPWSAAVVVGEAVLTYFIVYIISEKLSRWGLWCNFFGRDRFFALLIISVMVRLFCDSIFLPLAGQSLNNYFGIEFDYRSNLHSFGLIINALIANQLWKTGLLRGLFPFSVITGITYFIVRFGLMEFTNFNVGNLEFMYESVAVSLVASPKAYIILLTVAFMASRMNLRYGWDFNGILIPSLIALQWFQPGKILTTLIESAIIYSAGIIALKLPVIRDMTIEKARKVLLFFNISFLYKLIIGYIIYYNFPGVRTTDYYGFGYLLPTLIAMKIHDKHNAPRVMMATLKTSIIAVIFATFIGYGLSFVPDPGFLYAIEENELKIAEVKRSDQTLLDHIRKDELEIYNHMLPDSIKTPQPWEIEIFSQGLRILKNINAKSEPELLKTASTIFSRVNYKIIYVKERYVYLREKKESNGWGFFIIDTENPEGIQVEVPVPLKEWLTVESAFLLFKEMKGRSLAIAGASPDVNSDGSSDVTRNIDSFFHAFHKIFGRRNSIQVRAMTRTFIRKFFKQRTEEKIDPTQEYDPLLLIKGKISKGLRLSVLKKLLGNLDVKWASAPDRNIQREYSSASFSSLYLPRNKRRELFSMNIIPDDIVEKKDSEQSIEGYIQEWLFRSKDKIAGKGSEKYVRPDIASLLFIDEQIFSPLVELSGLKNLSNKLFDKNWKEELDVSSFNASLFSYKLTWYLHKRTGDQFLILSEDESRLHWGTYVIRIGKASPYIIQIPRPVFESNTFEFGISMFERMKARALCISGTHPEANSDLSSDVLNRKELKNVFNLFNIVFFRETESMPLMTLQLRGMADPGSKRDLPDILVSFADGSILRNDLTDLGDNLMKTIDNFGFSSEILNGSKDHASFEAIYNPQNRFLKYTKNKELAVVWLSKRLRSQYRNRENEIMRRTQFYALGIKTEKISIPDELNKYLRDFKKTDIFPVKLKNEIELYIKNRNIIILSNIMKKWNSIKLTEFIDINTLQSFLLIRDLENNYAALVSLNRSKEGETVYINNNNNKSDILKIEEFVNRKAGWLELKIK